MVEEQVDTSHCNRINRSRDTVVACWRREGGVGRTKTIGEGRIRGAQLRCRWKKKKDESERQRERTRFKEETHHLWKNRRRRRRRRRRKGGGGAKKKLLFREGDFLGSVRGPTGRWNPRSRLIAIKAPLGPRLWIFYSQSSSFSLYAGAHTVLHRVHHASPPPFLFRSVIRRQAKPLSSSSSLSRGYRERSLLLLFSPLLPRPIRNERIWIRTARFRNNGDIDGPHGMRANGPTTGGHAFRQPSPFSPSLPTRPLTDSALKPPSSLEEPLVDFLTDPRIVNVEIEEEIS